jgi:ATP-dependent protease ClpP protease subunit
MPENILSFPKSKIKSILRLNAKTNSDSMQLDLFGVVGGDFWSDGGITRDTFAKILKDIPNSVKNVDVRLSSPGGDVFEGRAIANLMADHRARFDINVIAECCSIASIIAMAGDSVHMSEGSVFLVHRCHTIALGNSKELKALSQDLEKIDNDFVDTYKKKTKMKEKDIIDLMDENRYMDAKEAKKLGFVDSISVDENTNATSLFKIAAMDIDRKKFHLPPLPKDYQPREACKAALVALDRIKTARGIR